MAQVEKRHRKEASRIWQTQWDPDDIPDIEELIAQALAEAEARGREERTAKLKALVAGWREDATFARSEQTRLAAIGGITNLAQQRIHERLNDRHAEQLEAVLKEAEPCQKKGS